MSKSTNFAGQPVYNQVINLLDKAEIVKISRETKGSEAYVKCLDGYQHLVIMLFGVLKHFDSLRELETAIIKVIVLPCKTSRIGAPLFLFRSAGI